MKRLFLLFIVSILSSSLFSQFTIGGGLTYDVGDNLGIRGSVSSDVNDEWRGQLSYSYFFSDWAIDLDAQYKLVEFETGYEEGYVLPFAGLNINRDKENNDTELGINLGINLSVPIEEFKVFFEPKVTIAGIGGFILTAGVMF